MHEIIYRLHQVKYLANDYVLRPGDDTTQLFLIVSGTVEYVTEVDGNDFVMKILEAGSVINPRNFIVDDLMYIDIKC